MVRVRVRAKSLVSGLDRSSICRSGDPIRVRARVRLRLRVTVTVMLITLTVTVTVTVRRC